MPVLTKETQIIVNRLSNQHLRLAMPVLTKETQIIVNRLSNQHLRLAMLNESNILVRIGTNDSSYSNAYSSGYS